MDTTITLPAGGKLHASRSHLCLAFEKTRFSLSTAIYGGGFKEINYAVRKKRRPAQVLRRSIQKKTVTSFP